MGLASIAIAQPADPAANAQSGGVSQHAVPSRLAARSVMLDIARAGARLVAVGERGRVVLSDDAGTTWRQSTGVPVSVTLTAVAFADARSGWAIGHAGVVIHTQDAGETWTLQLDGQRAADLALKAATASADAAALTTARQWVTDGPDKPFLALHFTSARSGTVVGAYGLVFSTDDGGATWASRLADVENPGGLHLNAIRTVGSTTYIAGEKGLLLRSEAGGRFAALKSPYEGSWFALDAMPGTSGGVVVAGLRGNAYASEDGGRVWQKLEFPSAATLSHASRLADGSVVFVDQGGSLFALGANRRFLPIALPPGPPLTAIAQTSEGPIVGATLRGPVKLPIELPTVTVSSASR